MRTVVGGFRVEVQLALVDNVITASEAERMRSLRLVASLCFVFLAADTPILVSEKFVVLLRS